MVSSDHEGFIRYSHTYNDVRHTIHLPQVISQHPEIIQGKVVEAPDEFVANESEEKRPSMCQRQAPRNTWCIRWCSLMYAQQKKN